MYQKYLPFLKALPRALFNDMQQGGITLRAMSLVYTTLLSLAPLLALSFSVLKGFGVHNQMETVLLSVLAPMGEKAGELTQQVLGFVDNMRVGVLGFTGLAVLIYTVISLMQKIENAFNHIWHVEKARSLTMQFRDYLSVIMVGPILMFSALGLWTSFRNTDLIQNLMTIEPFGTMLAWLLSLVPNLLIVLAFTFIYLFVPNTRVKPLAAFGGAVVAGILWQTAGWVFATFVVKSGQQTAIYSVFASLFLFMLWLYVGWMIVLTGSRMAYYFQHPDAVFIAMQPERPSLQTRELLALGVLREIGRRFQAGEPPPDQEDLRRAVPVSSFLLEFALDDLLEHRLISRDDDEPPHYLLRTTPEKLTLEEVRHCFWQGNDKQRQQSDEVQQALELPGEWVDKAAECHGTTLKTLVVDGVDVSAEAGKVE